MGKRGPQPTPTNVLAERGSWIAKTDARQNEIKMPAAPAVPEPPAWLTPEGREQYDRVAANIHGYGLLATVDVDILAAYCERLSQYITLRDEAARTEYVMPNGRANPIHAMTAEAQRDCVRLIRELGLSPAARVGLTIDKPKAKIGEIVDARGGFAT